MSLFLHLSDLHLGCVKQSDIPDDFKSDIEPLDRRLSRQQMLKETLTQLAVQLADSEELHAVIISGDITVANDEGGFEMLEEVLGWLGTSRPPPERIVVVPGNHDVQWEVSGEVKYERFIKHVRNKGYITPLLEGIDLKGGTMSVSDASKHYLLDHNQQWAVVPINSAHYCGSVEPLHAIPDDVWHTLAADIASKKTGLDEGLVARELRKLRLRDVARISNPDQMNAIRDLASTIRGRVGASKPPPLLIGVVHHQLLPVSVREELKPFESMTNLGHLRMVLRDNGYSAVLHGHKHASHLYYDHISEMPHSQSAPAHRLFVISAPAIKTPGAAREIFARLIRISGEPHAPTFELRDVASVESGTSPQLPPPVFYSLWQSPSTAAFNNSPVNLVEGETVDEVYERALALFTTSSLLPNVICRIATLQHPTILPRRYPSIPDVPEAEREAWFRRIVDWWQRHDFKRLSAEQHFNHGYRIYRYERGVNQFDRVAEAIKHVRKTSRGVITLLRPTSDELDNESSRFPSFCFVQFVLRDEGAQFALEVIAYFRKQEVKFWWPVNVAELAELQFNIFQRLRADVEKQERKPLTLGIITTIAATAHVGSEIPGILTPAVDFELEESPHTLWDMTYAICWDAMPDRENQLEPWNRVLNDLIPAHSRDRAGASVSLQGVQYLAELAAHFARHHDGRIAAIASKWKELEKINQTHAKSIMVADGRITDEEHREWRDNVLSKLNEIRLFVNEAFVGKINELR
jgi:hypothetical protein